MEKLKIGVEQLSESSSFVSIRHQRRWVEVEVERGNHKLAEVHFSIFQVTTKSEESQRTKSVDWESTFYWPFLENYIVVKYDWLRICSVMIKSWKFSIFIIAIFASGTLSHPNPVFWWIETLVVFPFEFPRSAFCLQTSSSAFYPFTLEHLHTIPHTWSLILRAVPC